MNRPNLSFRPRVDVDSADIDETLRLSFGKGHSERLAVAETLTLAEKDLQDYDAEVHKLQLHILYLNLQKRRLQDYTNKLRSLQAPIRNLPNEILLRIFCHCCDNDVLNYLHRIDIYRAPMALLISAVCTRWRELAQSYPRLWSQFSASLAWECDDDELVPKLKYYLARSKDHPLSLEISPSTWWDEEEDETDDHPGLELLVARTSQWRHFSFHGVSLSVGNHPSLDSELLTFPALETVSIDQEPDGQKAERELFQHAPRLHTLSLINTHFDVTERRFPWAQITTLAIPVGFGKIYKAVQLCPDLRNLSIDVRNCLRSRLEPAKVSITSNISSLTVTSCGRDIDLEYDDETDPLSSILSSFTLPSLTALALIGRTGFATATPWPGRRITSLLARSNCIVTSLCLSGISLSDQAVVELLQRLPSIEELTIHDSTQKHPDETNRYRYQCHIHPVTTRLVQSLHGFNRTSLHGAAHALVPHLRKLSLSVSEASFEDIALIETVQSRWLPDSRYAAGVGPACLRSVSLFFWRRETDLSSFSSLDWLEKAGMRVVIAKNEQSRFSYKKCGRCE